MNTIQQPTYMEYMEIIHTADIQYVMNEINVTNIDSIRNCMKCEIFHVKL